MTGLALVRLGRFGEALPYLERATERGPENRDFQRLYIAALEREALQQLEAGGAPEAVLSAFREHLVEFEAGRAIRDR